MNETSLISVADSSPVVMLTQAQLRQIIRHEIESTMNCRRGPHVENNVMNENRLSDKPYLTVKEAAELSGFGVSTIRLYIHRGLLKRCQIKSRRIVIARAELDRFMSSVATV
jgi:excisionase family DNA binding protein